MVRFVARTCVQDVMGHTSLLVNYSFSNGFGDKPQYIKWVKISFAVAIVAQGVRSPGGARGVWIPTRIYLHKVEPIVCECFTIESFGIMCALTLRVWYASWRELAFKMLWAIHLY